MEAERKLNTLVLSIQSLSLCKSMPLLTGGWKSICIVIHDVMFHNTPKLILTNPNHPQCYGTQPASRPTPTNTKPTSVTPPALRSHLACPSDSRMTWWTPDRTRSPARASLPLRHLGTNYPCPASWASIPISASGIKTRPRPHCNPDSVLHIVIVRMLFPSRPWVSYSCMHPWCHSPLHPCTPRRFYYNSEYIRTPTS